MKKTAKLGKLSILVPTIGAASHISDAQRQALRASLDDAHADIVAGDFDVVTSETLRAEFEGLFHDERTDDELECKLNREWLNKAKLYTSHNI